MLISAKADLDVEDKNGLTPLSVASKYGHLEAVKILAKKCKVSVIDKRGQSVLHCAAENSHFDVIDYLLKEHLKDLNLDAQDRHLQTALHFAVINSDVNIVNRLIECGASLKIKDKVNLLFKLILMKIFSFNNCPFFYFTV